MSKQCLSLCEGSAHYAVLLYYLVASSSA